jgi:hypothetical protein
MKSPSFDEIQQGIDGVAIKGIAGGSLTVFLGNINTVVAIMVGVATFIYVVLKIHQLLTERKK